MYKEVNKFSSNVPSHAVTFTSSNNNNSSASNRQSILAYKQSEKGKQRLYSSGQGSHNHGLGILVSPLNQNNSQSEFRYIVWPFSHCMQFQQLLFLYLLRAKNNRKFSSVFIVYDYVERRNKVWNFPLFLYFFFCSLFRIYLKPPCLFH